VASQQSDPIIFTCDRERIAATADTLWGLVPHQHVVTVLLNNCYAGIYIVKQLQKI